LASVVESVFVDVTGRPLPLAPVSASLVALPVALASPSPSTLAELVFSLDALASPPDESAPEAVADASPVALALPPPVASALELVFVAVCAVPSLPDSDVESEWLVAPALPESLDALAEASPEAVAEPPPLASVDELVSTEALGLPDEPPPEA
jgi:hypothetical protein